MRVLKTIFFRLFLLITLFFSCTSSALAQTNADLAVHYVEGQPKTDQYAYDVAVYFSVFQAGGDPIRDLPVSEIAITEDGKKVEITGLEMTDADEPINVVVVLDTSGSMRGAKMDAARSAAAQLISGLGKDDLAAVLSFNSQVKTESSFTNNLDEARKQAESLAAVEGAGTCFYDAINEAITLTATLPVGRRAMIILTDGVDELPGGGKCSQYREEDVVNLAKAGGTRVPIYTVGLGAKVDTTGLQRIADSTGGRYQFASDEQKLQGLFGKLLEQLRSQYRVTYVSTAAPGPHQLVLEAKINGQPIRQLRDFVLPNFAYNILVNSPREGDIITGKTKFNIQVTGQGKPIAGVEIQVNGKSIGVIEKMPYELDWEPAAGETGEAQIDVIALSETGAELARRSLKVTFAPATTVPAPVTESTPVASPTEKPDPILPLTALVLVSVVGLLLLAVLILVIVLTLRRKQKGKEPERQWYETEAGKDKTEAAFVVGEDRTLDAFIASPDALGMLIVLESDDPVLKGQRFEITRPSTTLGRKADNDLLFPKDSPVSRHHAVIEQREGGLFLSEIMATDEGAPKRPVYGTFVNDQQVEGTVRLKNGDEIRLGKRVRLHFESVEQSSDDEKTVQLDDFGGDKTMDSFGGG